VDKEVMRVIRWLMPTTTFQGMDPSVSDTKLVLGLMRLAVESDNHFIMDYFCGFLAASTDPVGLTDFRLQLAVAEATKNGSDFFWNTQYWARISGYDHDGDGWSDVYELFAGTDPWHPLDSPGDRDCDGVMDIEDADIDADGQNNNVDNDDDGDGILDVADLRPHHFDVRLQGSGYVINPPNCP